MLLAAAASTTTSIQVTSSGPAVTAHGWVAIILVIGSVCLALLAAQRFYTKILGPLLRGAEVVIGVATEFRPNSGGSLRDQIDTINLHCEELKTGQAEIKKDQAVTLSKVAKLWDYTHESHHDISGVLSAIAPTNALVIKLVDSLGPHPQRINEEKPKNG